MPHKLWFALVAAAGCSSSSSPQPTVGGVPAAQPAAASAPAPASAPTEGYQGLGVASVPPEVLAKHAAPPLAPDESRHIQAMLDVRAPGSGVVAPDGQRMFFTWNVTGTTQIWRLDGAMSFPVQLTGGEDTTLIADLTPDGKRLLVTRDRSGEENPGLYVLSPDGGKLQPIQHKPGVQTFLNAVSDDSRFVYYHSNDLQKDSYALYRYELATGKRETLYSEPGLWRISDQRNGGAQLLLAKSVGSNMAEYFELEVATKKLRPLFGQDEREDYRAVYGVAGEVLVLTPKLGEFRRLYAWQNGKLEPITPELKHDVSAFSIDRQKKRIYYQVNEGGYTRVFALDAKTKKSLAMPALPDADHVFFGMTSANGRFTAMSIDPGTAPVQAYVYDWEARSLKRWHKPATPEIDTSKFARSTLESYKARDGTSIPMFVRQSAACAAKKDAPCPVVVSFHGGPEGQATPGFSTSWQMFVDAGFTLVEPNVRGSDGYGKTWIHADDGPKRLQIITDIEDASKHVRTRFAVAGKAPKVGIYGGSYGGYATLIGMTMFAGAYDAGVSVVGISSFVTFLENTASYRRVLRISEYGDPEKDRKALEALSPTQHLDKLKGPLLLIQGATDPRVPVGEALQMYAALQKKNIPSGLIVFPDEGHGMRKRGNQVLSLGHAIRFLKKHLM
jgi:dipeptidyl aminopeptidase/acylaminoacyl peptidase